MAKKTININQPQDFINVGSAPNSKDGDSLRSAFARLNDAIDNIDSNFSELYTAIGQPVDGNLKTDIVGSVFADDSSVIVDSIDSKVTANAVTGGSIRISGHTIDTVDSSSIIVDQAISLNSNVTVGGDILPSTANGGDLGSAAKPWRSLYVSNNTIYIGGNSLGLDNNGNLAWNGSIVAHADGEFVRLDALTDVNAPNPNAGDTLAWMGSQYVNVPLREDRLHSEGDEVVLVGGANPYVTFPAITGGDQLIIQGAEVSSVSGSLALTSQDNLNIIANGSGAAPGGSKSWTFSADGSLTIPGDIRSEQAINIDINLSDSTLRRWSFGEDGDLTLPGGMTIETEYGGGARLVIDGKGNFVDIRDSGTILIGYNSTGNVAIGNPEGGTFTEIVSEKVIFLNQSVPATSIGVAGDSAGRIAFDSTYIYYCTGLYNGSSNIWKRVAWSGDTW